MKTRTGAAALVLAALTGCGGAAGPTKNTTTKADDCLGYEKAVRPALSRMGRAADAFGAKVGGGPDAAATASRDLAAHLDEEHGKLAAVTVDRDDLGSAHRRMLGALAGLADALRYLGDVVARRDESRRDAARTRYHDAQTAWQDAVSDVKRVCPQTALP
jgi:hypothetical protein